MNEVKIVKIIVIILAIIIYVSISWAEDYAEIVIDCSMTNKINPMIFGHNALGFRYLFSAKKKPRDFSFYGAGQWDVSTGNPNEELVGIAKEIKMSVLRFPGGGGTSKYKWKETIGPLTVRPFFKFGLDEFMKLCEATGAEPMITISFFSNTDEDISNLIEYLNKGYKGRHQEKPYKWANARARNGHPETYGVKYFELGNEVYWPRRPLKGRVSAREYSRRYLKVRAMLKSIDKNIQLGAILHNSDWNHEISNELRDSMDFGIVHMYPCNFNSNDEELPPNELFKIALAGPNQYDRHLVDIAQQLRLNSGKTIPIAITEYNGGFRQDEPVPYRHSLGNALLIADMIRVFLTTDAPILSANYWHFTNSYWGILYNPNYREGKGRYYFRPNFFVFKMFANYFGDTLVESTVSCRGYTSNEYEDIKKTEEIRINNHLNRPHAAPHSIKVKDWMVNEKPSVNVSRNSKEIRLTFDQYVEKTYFETKVQLRVQPGHSYHLTASIKTVGLSPSASAYLEVQDLRGWSGNRWAKQTNRVSGTTNWDYVSVKFTPVDDHSSSVNIIVGYTSKITPLKGSITLKDVVLHDLGPKKKYSPTPYLSAIASTNDKKDRLYLMVVNKNLTDHMPAIIRLKDFDTDSKLKVYTLNGSAVDETNENRKTRVKISNRDFRIKPGATHFEFIFEPHSVTALEIRKNTP